MHVIHKGTAGIGNRIKVLGRCVEIARGGTLYVDWYDTTWYDGFYDYFELIGFPKTQPKLNGLRIFPGVWTVKRLTTGGIESPEFRKEAINGFRCPMRLPTGWNESYDVIVGCDYTAKYTNNFFKQLRAVPRIREALAQTLKQHNLTPGTYKCWHVRNTDKKGADPEHTLRMAAKGDVLITDDILVQVRGLALGLICPSLLPVTPCKGVHHYSPEQLKVRGMTRRDLNTSCIVDLFIGGLAKDFRVTCKLSTYSEFIERARAVDWFKHALT